MKKLLEKRVSEARATSTNSSRHVSMEIFIGILSEFLAEIEQHHTLSANYGIVPHSTASSSKDSTKSKQGENKAGGKDSKSTICSGGGIYHSLDKCLFKEHPWTWEKSSALAKLKAKFPDDELHHRLNRNIRIDGTPLEKPIEIPKGKKGTKVRCAYHTHGCSSGSCCQQYYVS